MEEASASCACGAALSAQAAWCPRCHAPRVEPAVLSERRHPSFVPVLVDPAARVSSEGVAAGRAGVGLPPHATAPKVGRFDRTDVSFGLTGRIIATVLLLVPLAWFIYLVQWMITLGGLVIYAFVVLPMALRDIWRHPQRRR